MKQGIEWRDWATRDWERRGPMRVMMSETVLIKAYINDLEEVVTMTILRLRHIRMRQQEEEDAIHMCTD